jgi:hypothetical protein
VDWEPASSSAPMDLASSEWFPAMLLVVEPVIQFGLSRLLGELQGGAQEAILMHSGA